jgi:hypothetical protein
MASRTAPVAQPGRGRASPPAAKPRAAASQPRPTRPRSRAGRALPRRNGNSGGTNRSPSRGEQRPADGCPTWADHALGLASPRPYSLVTPRDKSTRSTVGLLPSGAGFTSFAHQRPALPLIRRPQVERPRDRHRPNGTATRPGLVPGLDLVSFPF